MVMKGLAVMVLKLLLLQVHLLVVIGMPHQILSEFRRLVCRRRKVRRVDGSGGGRRRLVTAPDDHTNSHGHARKDDDKHEANDKNEDRAGLQSGRRR